MLNVVYFMRPLRTNGPAYQSEELRYSLRSLAANVELGSVHLFGGIPDWVNPDTVDCHPVRQTAIKHENTWALWGQIAEACRRGDLPDDFIMLNDDHFAMEPITTVPGYTRGLAADWAAQRRGGGATSLADAMDRTVYALHGYGVESPRSFELHTPQPFYGPTLAAAWPEFSVLWSTGRVCKRTLYGNLHPGPAVELAADVKVRDRGDVLPDFPWWSSSDETFRFPSCKIGAVVRDRFRDRCVYERRGVTMARSTTGRPARPRDTPTRQDQHTPA